MKPRSKIARVLALGFALLLVSGGGGCATTIRGQDAALIRAASANAQQFNAAVQADPAVPEYVREWVAEDARQWQLLTELSQ